MVAAILTTLAFCALIVLAVAGRFLFWSSWMDDLEKDAERRP